MVRPHLLCPTGGSSNHIPRRECARHDSQGQRMSIPPSSGRTARRLLTKTEKNSGPTACAPPIRPESAKSMRECNSITAVDADRPSFSPARPDPAYRPHPVSVSFARRVAQSVALRKEARPQTIAYRRQENAQLRPRDAHWTRTTSSSCVSGLVSSTNFPRIKGCCQPCTARRGSVGRPHGLQTQICCARACAWKCARCTPGRW